MFNCFRSVFQNVIRVKLFNANMKLITIWRLFIILKTGIWYFIIQQQIQFHASLCYLDELTLIDIREFLRNFKVF